MSVNIEGNVSRINAGDSRFWDVKAGIRQEKEKAELQTQTDDGVKVSISQEGIASYRKRFCESGLDGANGKVMAKESKDSIIRQAKQAAGALSANNYNNELAKETEKLKGQRTGSGSYSLSNRMEDFVRAYGNIYDEIVQRYQNGTGNAMWKTKLLRRVIGR